MMKRDVSTPIYTIVTLLKAKAEQKTQRDREMDEEREGGGVQKRKNREGSGDKKTHAW
jgi:hypothetical protein